MKAQKKLAGILTLILFVTAVWSACAEAKPVNTELNGKIRQTDWIDETGNLTSGPEGYATVKYSNRKDGTAELYFDKDGKPYMTDGGYYGRVVTKDLKGHVIQIEYLDQDGDRAENNRGYAMVAMTYYGFGEVRSVTYYGLDRKPTIVPSLGYASVYNEYSNKTMASRTFRDEKGNPVDGAEGYAAVKQKLNKSYQVIRIRYEHADGSPALGPDGWYRCVKERDSKGRVTSTKYYDVNDQLTDRGAGYAWEETEYAEDGSIRITRYNLKGEKVTDAAGVATLIQEMTDEQIIKERYLDQNGQPCRNENGVDAVLYSYDSMGRIEKVTYQNTEGNPMLCLDGYSGYRDQRDEDGLTVSRTFLGTDGLAIELPGGYSEIRYFYDDTKVLVSTRYYDLNGTQVVNE